MLGIEKRSLAPGGRQSYHGLNQENFSCLWGQAIFPWPESRKALLPLGASTLTMTGIEKSSLAPEGKQSYHPWNREKVSCPWGQAILPWPESRKGLLPLGASTLTMPGIEKSSLA